MSDIAGIVTGIQGLSVSDNQPQDGYVLTWDSENNYWIGKFNGLNVIYCSDNTTWTAPDGVSSILDQLVMDNLEIITAAPAEEEVVEELL